MQNRMDTRRQQPGIRVSIFFCLGIAFGLLLTTCSGQPTLAPSSMPPAPLPSETPTSPAALAPTSTLACVSGLSFLEDLTIPDNSLVLPENLLDKQWLVLNSGSCNWDERYRIRLISGVDLGARPEQALYPARSGSRAVLRLIFSAPQSAGAYLSEWQAYDPGGMPFGDTVFIKIIVQP